MRRLHIEEGANGDDPTLVARIVATYTDLITRVYCYIRFRIIPLRFLAEMSQYVGPTDRVLDIGCGFGLFTLYFALQHPHAHFVGVDRSVRRILAARRAAAALGVGNVTFLDMDVRQFHSHEPCDTVVMLDVLHHLPPSDGESLVAAIFRLLVPGGVFLLKDVTTRPRWMLYFTFLLDWLMNPRDAFFYRSAAVWTALLRRAGFAAVEVHYLWDVLPYPHVLLVSRKPRAAS
jgi:cyclopropane fatty-acyl-phospholipid synthase-like methyltransferase